MPDLSIPEATYRRLAERAAALGTTVHALAARLLADDTPGPAGVLDFLDRLPAARTPAEWDAADREFAERRGEWER